MQLIYLTNIKVSTKKSNKAKSPLSQTMKETFVVAIIELNTFYNNFLAK